MKKFAFITFVFFLSLNLKGQINLEYTFTSSSGIGWFLSDSYGIMFYTSDTVTNQIKFYKEDYSFYKTVTLYRPIGYSMGIGIVSEKLFNSNNSIEFICYFSKTNDYKTKLFDDNATLLKDFGSNNYYMYAFLISKGTINKLAIRKYQATSPNWVDEIYSLPGSMPHGILSQNYDELLPPFPNPSNSFITIPYKLKNGESASLKIINLQGQLIDEKIIDSAVDKIILNIANYKAGVYIYEYNGITNKFIVN